MVPNGVLIEQHNIKRDRAKEMTIHTDVQPIAFYHPQLMDVTEKEKFSLSDNKAC